MEYIPLWQLVTSSRTKSGFQDCFIDSRSSFFSKSATVRMYSEIKSILHSAVRGETIGCFEETIGCFEETIGCFSTAV